MKIPKTTEDKPYIEFRITKRGTIKLAAAPWITFGGINGGFYSTDGTRGNACKPQDLEKCINAFKKKEIRDLEKEIKVLQKKLEKLNNNL